MSSQDYIIVNDTDGQSVWIGTDDISEVSYSEELKCTVVSLKSRIKISCFNTVERIHAAVRSIRNMGGFLRVV